MKIIKSAFAYPLFLVFLCPLLSGCGHLFSGSSENNTALSMITATDLHYLSSSLTDHGPYYAELLGNGDGKMTYYCEEITDAFFSEVLAAKPDALILSGDLTFNGERQSHLDLAEKLDVLISQDIPVLVIPGNHDIGYPFARRFEGDKAYRTDNITVDDFKEIYGNTGMKDALSRDEATLSYVYPLSADTWILLLDVNTGSPLGSIPSTTAAWAKRQLSQAQKEGITVITVTHQNAVVHNQMFAQGYVINGRKDAAQLLREGGVKLNLSGHIHIQHIAEEEGLYEAATGSLAVTPNQYGLVTMDDRKNLSYSTRPVDVAAWARKQKKDSKELLNFPKTSRNFFDECTRKKVAAQLKQPDLSKAQIEEMTEFAVEINRLYFSGALKEQRLRLMEMDAWRLWQDAAKEGRIFFADYLVSLMGDQPLEETSLDIPGDSLINSITRTVYPGV